MLLKFSFNHDACHLSKDLIYFLCVYLWERKGSSSVKKTTYWFLELKYLCEYLLMLFSIINQQKKFSNGCKGFQVRNLTKRYPAFFTFFSSLTTSHIIYSYSVNNGKSSMREIVSIKQKWTLILQLNTSVKKGQKIKVEERFKFLYNGLYSYVIR